MLHAHRSVPPGLRSLGPPRSVPPADHPVAALGRFWYPKPPAWPPIVSLAVHIAVTVVLILTIGDLLERPAGPGDSVVFLPPLQQQPPETAGGGGGGGSGNGTGLMVAFTFLSNDGVAAGVAAGVTGQGGSVGGRGGRGSSIAPKFVARFASDTTVRPGDNVYTEFQVDNAVQFSNRSAVPQYPLDLLARGVQGEVTVRFVVDTSGTADVHSLEIIDSSDPQFTASVRQALPRMRFSPARLNGRRVRQLVEQPFRFNIDLSTLAPSDSSA